MHFTAVTLCILHLLVAQGFSFFGVDNDYAHLIDKIQLSSAVTNETIITRWIVQKLDNFDPNENRTWQMRYYERTDFWKTNGPVYLFLFPQYAAIERILEKGFIYEMAKETEGAMFLSEHRYYGKSQPLDGSNIENMKYLSASQALADNANLLRAIKRDERFKDSKIVVVGPDYAGNLAAWMRLFYPDLVDAAIASSAPVLAKRDFHEYFEIISHDYKKYGTEDCLETIQKVFQRYEQLFETEEGMAQLKKEFNICEKTDLTKLENKQLLFFIMTNHFSFVAQWGTNDSIYDFCTDLKDNEKMRFIYENNSFNFKDDDNCLFLDFDYMIEVFGAGKSTLFFRLYQSCTEFGQFKSTTSDNHPFTKNIPIEWYQKVCTSMFGPEFDEDRVNTGVSETNELYGGQSINVTKVIFVNGELDPLKALGVMTDISEDAPVVLIPKTGHCRELFPSRKTDSEELTEARSFIKRVIKKWIELEDTSRDL